MTKKERALLAIEKLKEIYPEAVCSLTYRHPYELLIATRLSAQCTDARVNIVTEVLFEKYPTLESLANAEFEQIEEIVRPCGLGKTKAKDIIKMTNQLIDDYHGVVPDSIEELTKLSGVGRKTANLIVGDVYGKPSIVTDTHCIRICGRLGLTDGSTVPLSVERQLQKILPPKESGDFCHRLVHFGREYCTARSPKCDGCPLFEICKNKTKKIPKKG
ncbi:UV-endonuclease [uncultured Ruminococcus sp.]|uniref:Endonuclease III n=1 Tax=Massiliimalia timonensis TaxID=1987501 RepID=A0A8J6P4C9_9FIRM|nr:endonuclease III [Massiliimalia timonensis]MBC8611043.1 endonuclease III [Massiliimalia timonensis]SCG97897.1 UV-endonuclease [uncultured Ruminococcus sp.]SCH69433.1 UV-endonuclease [uncultured Clostridium sp.]